MARKKPAPKEPQRKWRNRIVGHDEVDPEQLLANPKNWRIHPKEQQQALEGVLAQVGWVQDCIVNQRTGFVVDGHARVAMAITAGERVPVVYVDLSEEEEALILATLDPLAAMAVTDKELLGDLLKNMEITNEAIQRALGMAMHAKPEWTGMPDFHQENLDAFQTVNVHFADAKDRDGFSKLIGQSLTDQTKYIWHPPAKREAIKKRYVSPEVNPRYPLYIVSKGRWERPLTANALDEIKIPYRIVIEPQEYESYSTVIDPDKILTLPFRNLGEGSIPARNWIWEHAISEGTERHWILDDNIDGFIRMNENSRVVMNSGAGFLAMEDFSDRYENVALAGPQYRYLGGGQRSISTPPFITNTRIYSCILIKNDLPYRWRGRYNEDTDLSLRALKDGYCTILFNAFKINKIATMTMKGGNTEELYQGDGRLKMAESLRDQHPDVVRIAQKWGRWQHHVDYRSFKANRFIPKPGFVDPTESNNYGMELVVNGAA